MISQIHKHKTLLLITGAAALAAIGLIMYFSVLTKPTEEKFYPKASEKATESTKSTPTSSQAVAPSPTIPQDTTPKSSSSGKITIVSPTQGSTVKDGTVISGQATIGSGDKLYYRLKGGSSGQVAYGPVSLSGSAFSFPLGFNNEIKGGTDQGTLQVYSIGADGSETNIASVNVNIQG